MFTTLRCGLTRSTSKPIRSDRVNKLWVSAPPSTLNIQSLSMTFRTTTNAWVTVCVPSTKSAQMNTCSRWKPASGFCQTAWWTCTQTNSTMSWRNKEFPSWNWPTGNTKIKSWLMLSPRTHVRLPNFCRLLTPVSKPAFTTICSSRRSFWQQSGWNQRSQNQRQC